MQVKVESTSIDAVKIVIPEVFEDERGFFTEVYREDQFEQLGLPARFVQLNHSKSIKNVVRGLHFQWDPPMGKLMRVTLGVAFLVAVDLRKNSPTFLKHVGLSNYAEIQYLTTGIYNNKAESGIRWDDPDIGIEWPVKKPILSDKDMKAQSMKEWLKRPESDHFVY
jgi:dTDP-4-dehydrorhamnose 3,5-epimerase